MRTMAGVRRERVAPLAGLLGTTAVHALVVVFFAAAIRTPEPMPPVYAVELVAAPAPTEQRRLAPEAVAQPEPEPEPPPPEPAKTAPPEPAKPAPPKPEPKPAPRREPEPAPARQPENREKAPRTRSTETPLPGETPSTGTDVANVKTPGLQFAYPEYLRNLMNEILRRFGSQDLPLRAEVSFMIMRDGSVRSIQFVKRSGNFSFDLEAQGAIEAAANAGAFGPLPAGYENDVLPIVFVFEPR